MAHITMARLRSFITLLPLVPRAMLELARARLRLRSLSPRDILALNDHGQAYIGQGDGIRSNIKSSASAARIARVIPAVAQRVPWRADCLVQALAGQRWLNARGTHAHIMIGVDRPGADAFEAHAWLEVDGQVLLGGNISRYATVLRSTPNGHGPI